MIKIKDYILNENEIVFINEYDSETLGVILKGKDKCFFIDAHIEDIEYNYDSQEKQYNEETEQLISSLQTKNYKLQDKIEKLKKDLDIEINNSNIKSAQIKTKDTIIKKLQSAKDKTINYVNKKLNADEPILVEYEIETIIELLEGE